jgi:hypothetical protein
VIWWLQARKTVAKHLPKGFDTLVWLVAGIGGPSPMEESAIWWLQARKTVAKHLPKGFDTLVWLVAWSLWKERNRRVHEGLPFSRSRSLPPSWMRQGCG